MNKKFKWVTTASELHQDERYCQCCSKPLKGKVVMLELSNRTSLYYDGGLSAEESQGYFPFGMTCAAKKVQA